MSIKKNSHKVKGSTLVEMMVVMLLSGIVIGFLFEGVELFKRIERRIAQNISLGKETVLSYNIIDALVSRSDSLAHNQDIIAYRKGAIYGIISLCDSMIVINGDTLPVNIYDCRLRTGILSDTIIIQTQLTTLFFTTTQRPYNQMINKAQQKEYEQIK